jgi:hypothetical protein
VSSGQPPRSKRAGEDLTLKSAGVGMHRNPHVVPQFPTRDAIVGPAEGPDNGKRRTRAAVWAHVAGRKRDAPDAVLDRCGIALAADR